MRAQPRLRSGVRRLVEVDVGHYNEHVFVVDLTCAEGHVFEGWFDSREDVDEQLADGLLTCPSCGDAHVKKRPSFAAVTRSRSSTVSRAPSSETALPGKMPLEVQRALSKILQVVRAHGEDVGSAFADTAIAIHRGEQEARLIYGESTAADEAKLVDEGVQFAKLPVPEIDEN